MWADKGNRLAITFQERPASQDRLTQRCLPPVQCLSRYASHHACHGCIPSVQCSNGIVCAEYSCAGYNAKGSRHDMR